MSIGGIEAGGTRWTCAVGRGDGEVERAESFATTTPAETLGRAIEFFAAVPDLEAIGVGAFGPVEVNRTSPRWGTITTTPKPGWSDTDVTGPLAAALGVPIALDTDVNAAAVGEWRHGAARGLETFVYVTVGTGIGGGVFAGGRPIHGLLHPEVGHMLIPHDRARDPFEGSCPFHGDCLEGLASGTAMRDRWGRPGLGRAGQRAPRRDPGRLHAGAPGHPSRSRPPQRRGRRDRAGTGKLAGLRAGSRKGTHGRGMRRCGGSPTPLRLM